MGYSTCTLAEKLQWAYHWANRFILQVNHCTHPTISLNQWAKTFVKVY